MPIIEGTTRLKNVVGEYDFAVDGGAVGTITLRGTGSAGNLIPDGSLIYGGYIEVDTILAGTGASVSVGVNSTTDLLGTVAFDSATFSSTGRKAVAPAFNASATVRLTAARSIKIAISGAALTAGKFRVVLFCI